MIVWLASYPRSGNTFCRAVLNHYFDKRSYSIYGDRVDIASNTELTELVGHEDGDLQTLDLDALRQSADLFFIKTHNVPSLTQSDEDVVFYIVRDGRDACTSHHAYIKNIVGRKDTALEQVLCGDGAAVLWGEHVLRWYQAKTERSHVFRFEEITVDPDAFADRLADILGLERSQKPFPKFETFKNALPAFFGTGRVGAHREAFSAKDLVTFELYHGTALRLAGYVEGDVSSDEIAAYDVFIRNNKKARARGKNASHLEQRTSTLEQKLSTLNKQLERERQQRQALERKYAALEDRHDRLRARYNTVVRYTGLALIRWVKTRMQSLPTK